MAGSDYVVRLNGDNSNLQNALSQTRKALQETGATASKLEDIQKQFDKTANSSAPLRKRIADIKKQMEQMAVAGVDSTEAGKKMWETLRKTAQEYQTTLDKVNAAAKVEVAQMEEQKSQADELKDKISKLRKEMEELALAGQAKSPMFDQMAQQVADLEKQQKKASDAVNNSVSKKKGFDFKGMGQEMANKLGVGEAFNAITTAANPAMLAITATAGTMIAAGKAAADFENHLDDLQALTGMTDAEISKMSDTTLSLSKKFGASAGDIVDSMGLIGSQAPELLKDGEALAFVTDAAMTLGKAGSIAVEDAAKAITTVTNQMGVSTDEALNIANTLEAAEQQGSASVAYLNTAIEKSGTMAKKAGLSYVELAAMIETVGPTFSSADVAGTGLQGTLLALTSQANNDFNPAIVGMSKALENLNAAHLSNAEMTKLVGASNITMLSTMIDGRESFEQFATSIDGTNAAVDAWQTKTNNMSGAIDRVKATWDAFLITLGQSGLIQGIADNIMMVMEALGEIIDVISEVVDAFDGFFGDALDGINPLQVQLDILIAIVRAVGDVMTVVVKIYSKSFQSLIEGARGCADWIGEKWAALKKSLGDVAFARFVINAFEAIMNKVGSIISKIKEWWNDLKKSLGIEVKAEATTQKGSTPAQRKAAEAKSKKAIAEDQKKRNEEAASRATSTKKGGKSGGSKSSTKQEKIDYLVSVDDGSLDTAEKKLSAFQAKKKSLPLSATADIAKADEEVKKWTEEVERRKIALTVEGGVEGLKQLDELTAELQRLKDKRAEIVASVEGKQEVDKLNESIASLQGKDVKVKESTEVSASVEGAGEVEALVAELDKVKDKTASVNVGVNVGEAEVNTPTAEDVNITASVEVKGDEDVKALNNDLSALSDKTVNVDVATSVGEIPTVNASASEVIVPVSADTSEAVAEIDNIKGKTIEVDVVTNVGNTEVSASAEAVEIPVSADTSAVDTEIRELERRILRQKIALGIIPKVEDGSVNDLEAKIKKLEGEKSVLVNTKADPTAIKEIDDEIKALRDQLKAEKIRVGLAPDPNSLNGIKAQIKELEGQLALSLNSDLDPEAIRGIVDELDALRRKEKAKSIELGVTTAPSIQPREEKMVKGSVADKRQSLSNANSQAEQIKADYKLKLIGKDEALAQLAELDKQLSDLGLKPLELHVNDDGTITSAMDELEKYKAQMESTSDIIGNMGNVFGSLGSAIGGSAGEIMNFAGQSLNTIAQVLPQIITLITAKQAEAMASGTASAAALPFPANIAAIASIVATVASLFASLPKFENGGIVGGSSYHGDKLLARVNSGEMILNQKQQRNLANTLGAVGAAGGGGGVGGQVDFKIRGTALHGTLRNYDKKTSRIK